MTDTVTFRLTDDDLTNLAAIKERYGIENTTDAIRQALVYAATMPIELTAYDMPPARSTSATILGMACYRGSQGVYLRGENEQGVLCWRRV